MKNNFFLITFLFTSFLSFGQIVRPGSGYCLDFDGVDDYVSLGNSLGEDIKTIELWFKPDSTIDETNSEFISLFVRNDDFQQNEIQMYFSKTGLKPGRIIFGTHSASGANTIASDVNQWNAGQWYNVVGVFNSIEGLQLYVNGVRQSETVPVIELPGNRLEEISLGRWGNLNLRQFKGGMDEVRIWNVVLSEMEIRDWMCKKITSSHPKYNNLIAYYKFDENEGTTLIDHAGNNDGLLMNDPEYEVSGAAIGDESVYDYSGNPSVSLSHEDGDNITVNNFTGSPTGTHLYRNDQQPNSVLGFEGLENNDKYFGVFKIGDDSATYSISYDYTGNTEAENNESNLKLYRRVDNSSTSWEDALATLDVNSNTLSVTGANTEYILGEALPTVPAKNINFDGIDDYISVPRVFLLSGLTYAAWVKTTSRDATSGYAGNSALNIIGDSTNDIWNSFGIHGGYVRYSHYTGSWSNITSSTMVNDGQWHHIAVTHNQSTNVATIYIDGVSNVSGTLTYGGGGGTSKVAYDLIGASNQNSIGTQDYFQGDIDELQIWNYALSENEIRGYKDCELEGSESGLITYYHFNYGNANSDNTALEAYLPDASINTNNGTLHNFALNGVVSNYSVGSPVTEGCATLGFESEDIDIDRLLIYPNPTANFIKISGLGAKESYVVYNVLGEQILKGFIDQNTEVDVHSLETGVYLIRLKNGFAMKFIKK